MEVKPDNCICLYIDTDACLRTCVIHILVDNSLNSVYIRDLLRNVNGSKKIGATYIGSNETFTLAHNKNKLFGTQYIITTILIKNLILVINHLKTRS